MGEIAQMVEKEGTEFKSRKDKTIFAINPGQDLNNHTETCLLDIGVHSEIIKLFKCNVVSWTFFIEQFLLQYWLNFLWIKVQAVLHLILYLLSVLLCVKLRCI